MRAIMKWAVRSLRVESPEGFSVPRAQGKELVNGGPFVGCSS